MPTVALKTLSLQTLLFLSFYSGLFLFRAIEKEEENALNT